MQAPAAGRAVRQAVNESMLKKLGRIAARHREIGEQLARPGAAGDRRAYRELGREYAQLGEIVPAYDAWRRCAGDIDKTRQLEADADADMKAMAREELEALEARRGELELQLRKLLLPADPHDDHNVFLEIRAGTGGDEAALFAGDLFRMYGHYAEQCNWRVEVVNAREGEHGGFRELISRINGKGVYSRLKFESGAHRVQRVPETESQGRIHTSAATVAVMPEAQEIDDIEIGPNDLRIDRFRASGAGGQHVNKTDSAIRITHLPSGLIVECQAERSQNRNKARALALLKAKLLDAERGEQRRQQAENRRNLVGSGDRSQRIRTYNFPQGRVTDHRIGLTLYQLPQLMEGELDPLIQPLINEHQADLLAEAGGDE